MHTAIRKQSVIRFNPKEFTAHRVWGYGVEGAGPAVWDVGVVPVANCKVLLRSVHKLKELQTPKPDPYTQHTSPYTSETQSPKRETITNLEVRRKLPFSRPPMEAHHGALSPVRLLPLKAGHPVCLLCANDATQYSQAGMICYTG